MCSLNFFLTFSTLRFQTTNVVLYLFNDVIMTATHEQVEGILGKYVCGCVGAGDGRASLTRLFIQNSRTQERFKSFGRQVD